MAKAPPASSSPAATPPSGVLKRTTSSTQNMKNQKSILGFFQKSSPSTPSTARNAEPASSPAQRVSEQRGAARGSVKSDKKKSLPQLADLSPVPSSDLVEPEEDESHIQATSNDTKTVSPSRRSKKQVNYVESDSEGEDDDEKIFRPGRKSSQVSKRRKLSPESDDEFEQLEDDAGYSDEDMDDFIVADDSDEDVKASKKRKRPTQTKPKSSSVPPVPSLEEDLDLDIPDASSGSAMKWTYDPDSAEPRQSRTASVKSKSPSSAIKQKAHVTEPEQRYAWLANIRDIDGHSPGHPDYDPRTIYIPPLAWAKFSPFEKQYWEIKQKFWDTVVFFKKGKFYELYENDATIGHQLFDLKLTDRVNMRMVGVPEMSLDHWANQFVAKGYKIARVDQIESALGKEMRERDGKKGGKEDKVIRRELASVLTAGTLVEGSMLQDDMSTYCVAIKEAIIEDSPAFGLAFVDTATGQFFLSEFVDDADMTKFETFVAQTRPQELLLEKSTISQKALRILKNNTGPTTIWNHLKPGKEFWEADITVKELDVSEYFVSEDDDNLKAWPEALRAARDKELVMSAFGALVQYLRLLKLDRDLITIGNFSSYDPIKKASSLVLDGQTLINMEIFANSFDGGSDGTLFQLLNRCITPFGKRMFKQWVCHPLIDAKKINARLDAVDALNADPSIRDQFSSQLTKMPDLERLISRIHAANCKAQDFLRVLEGFEQIEYTVSLLKDSGSGEGVIGQLISAMPDLNELLEYWKTAFDHTKARENGILVPKRGVEEDFDNSQDCIEELHNELDSLLKRVRRELGSTAICYRDNGKEIYQLEVPIKVKNIPKNWDQMSATKQVKRYYFPELRTIIRKLQEAQETHSQIVKEVAGRFYARFDEHYATWLAAVKIISQLDCLISLAKASSSLGQPSCRPVFVEDKRSVLEFEELRHPCLLSSVEDFIPNDVKLGGDCANIDLLTGANAAGKSTVLRMTCVAVIMAQIGCYLPCQSARLTPVDRIMSRLGANDNIFAAQSTFFVELSETKKILSEATPRSLVILDELGRGTSSYDGVAVAQAVLHHVATHIGALGFFATHYHSLAAEFEGHPEITPKRMKIHVDDEERRVTFLYKLEDGVAEGSFGMHCAAMCGISSKVIERAEVAAKQWEHTSRLKESLERRKGGGFIGLGWWSDVAWALRESSDANEHEITDRGLDVLLKAIEAL
ncbi:muts domain V-domain-containing protein [Aspergillus pseudonomiae]|uniref:DNA mismatch repair protein n=1 Tax=Aspergillus pseudonomiae TaxID=1506151 RepID=A0A5N7DD28_9EURO|nr:muts domain V-domain-containing protein [Aspergillus pseudonomiae]KAB8265872.1 muts domain V-domain-containing protein [Aspergillus pseudonomiae]KAE8404277.1 muts domain V-domain-containing protein [Aspergillus pseudonomiae]